MVIGLVVAADSVVVDLAAAAADGLEEAEDSAAADLLARGDNDEKMD
jgi:hypothetical protein